MDKVAERAGVSASTVYRYFADRDELLQAVMASTAEWLHAPRVSTADDIAAMQEQLMADFDTHRALVRAIVVARVGRGSDWTGRGQRLEIWRYLLQEVTDHLGEDDALFGQAVISYLTGGLAWLTMADESGLDGAQAGRAVAWAIRALIADLRARNEEAKRTDAPRPIHTEEGLP